MLRFVENVRNIASYTYFMTLMLTDATASQPKTVGSVPVKPGRYIYVWVLCQCYH